MKKTIKIIDLLVKIANGEEVPKEIKFGTNYYKLKNAHTYYRINNSGFIMKLTDDYNLIECLNDDAEIIEDNKIEKLTFDDTDVCCVDGLMRQSLNIKNTINKIIDRLSEMDKGE